MMFTENSYASKPCMHMVCMVNSSSSQAEYVVQRAFYGHGVAMEQITPANALAVALEIHRSWTSTYQWITIAGGLVSFALAFVAGANDIPISVRKHHFFCRLKSKCSIKVCLGLTFGLL